MRTTEEILARIEVLKDYDVFDYQRNDLVAFLPFEAAQPFLREGLTAEEWTPEPQTAEAAIAKIRAYMPFAWDKANNRRALSADRSVEHMKAWLWLAGDPLYDKLDDLWDFYGKPCLAVVCEKYGIDWRSLDDNLWANEEDELGIPAPTEVTLPA